MYDGKRSILMVANKGESVAKGQMLHTNQKWCKTKNTQMPKTKKNKTMQKQKQKQANPGDKCKIEMAQI